MSTRLLTQACWRWNAWSTEDLHHILKVQSNVVMEEVGGHNRCPRACVAIEQRPVVEGQVFGIFLKIKTNRQ